MFHLFTATFVVIGVGTFTTFSSVGFYLSYGYSFFLGWVAFAFSFAAGVGTIIAIKTSSA